MKKLLLPFVILLSFLGYSQTYTIETSLNVRPGGGSWGDGCKNNINVRLYYRINGVERSQELYGGTIDLNGVAPFRNRKYSFNVTGHNIEITRVVTTASRNWRRDIGGCGGRGSFNDSRQEHAINRTRSTNVRDISRWWNADLGIEITPNISISFPSNETTTIGCASDAIEINSSSNGSRVPFSNPNSIYIWQYYDNISTRRQFNREYIDLTDEVLEYFRELIVCFDEHAVISLNDSYIEDMQSDMRNELRTLESEYNEYLADPFGDFFPNFIRITENLWRSYEEYFLFIENNSDNFIFFDDFDIFDPFGGSPCENHYSLWPSISLRRLNSFDEPRIEILKIGWRTIVSKTGQKDINLSIKDLSLYDEIGAELLNKPILVRIRTSHENSSRTLTVQYLPEPPAISAAPEIIQPTCSYSNDANFSIVFDRAINNNEQLDLTIDKLVIGQEALQNEDTPLYLLANDSLRDEINNRYAMEIANDPEITIRSANYDNASRRYRWNRELEAGQYVMRIAGFEIGDRESSAQCREFFYFFEIGAPEQVAFAVTKEDQRCPGERDGSLQITASGGSGTYEYILNGTNWSGARRFTRAQSPFTISNLSPGTYNIQVRDTNGCLDRENLDADSKVERLTIVSKPQITHTINQNGTNPIPVGAPDLSDGEIEISSLAGGTPREDINGAYFNYTVLLNGTVAGATGRAYLNNGFTIIGLPAGNHRIRYTDANACSRTLNLPTIQAPAPITYRLNQTTPSCAEANDGELRITNIQGGYPPYSITWRRNNIILPTEAQTITGDNATYALQITDTRSGAAGQQNIRFNNVPLPLTFTERVGEISCFGETAEVVINAEGGVPPYEYGVTEGSGNTVWYSSNTIEVPASFIGYRFQVRQTNNINCSTAASNIYRILEPEEFFIDDIAVTHNTIFEDNAGAIQITVVGPNSSYSVRWTKQDEPSFLATGTAISGLTAGYYIPTVTENTGICAIQGAPIFVDEPDELIVNIDAHTNRILCLGDLGGLITTTTGGSESYSYSWYTNGVLMPGEEAPQLNDLREGTYTVEVNDGYTTATASGTLVEPELLSLSVTGTMVSCFNGQDGTIVLQPFGGTPPYEVSIDAKQSYSPVAALRAQTLEGLYAGAYQVWLRDANGCEIATAQDITLTQPTEIIIAEAALLDVTTLGGNDGVLDIEISGGTGGYTITWTRAEDSNFNASTTALANLFYGVYTVVVVDDNNCEVQREFTIREPLPMVVQINEEQQVLCHADATGELVATVTGGYPIESVPADFEYRWYRVSGADLIALNTDVTLDRIGGLAVGVYRVDVNDVKGASATTQFEIMQPDDLVAVLEETPTDVLCHGDATGRIAITVTGGPKDANTGLYLPYTYSWTKVGDRTYEAATEDVNGLTAGTYHVTVTDANLCTVTIENISVIEPEAALEVANSSVIHLTGFETQNGSVAVTIAGGVLPYRYRWEKLGDANFSATTADLEGLSQGTYQLTVTDAHECSISFEQAVLEPELLVTAITPLSLAEGVQCQGETTVAPLVTTTSGGVSPYTYAWVLDGTPTEVLFTTANSPLVVAGIYTVNVTDANGNVAQVTYEVEEPSILEISATPTHLLCHNDTDGAIDISVSGGVPPYRYQWSNGATTEDLRDLRAGLYTVTVTDANGCMLEREVNVEQPRALSASVNRVFPSAAGLSDGSITLNIFGGTTPYSYQWRDSSGAIVANTQHILNDTGIEKYAVTITDANRCTLTIDDVDLFEPPILEVFIAEISVVSCFGNTETGRLTAVVEGGIPFNADKQYDYAWYNADTDLLIGRDAEVLEAVGAGNYYVIVTDVLRTSTTSAVFRLEEPELLEVVIEADFINCGDENDWTLDARVQGGTAPYQYLWNTGVTTDHIAGVVAGTYRIEILDQRGCTAFAEITNIPPPSLTLEPTLTDPVCYGGCDGSILLEVAGGSPPYTYTWNNATGAKDLTNACAGVYTVRVTDSKGCFIEDTQTLTNPEQRVIDLGEDITLCQDQTIVIDATVNEADVSYKWTADNGFTATTARVELSATGTYTVHVTDAKGCVATDTIVVEATTQVIYTDFIGSSQVFVDEKFLLFDISDPIPSALAWVFPKTANIHYQDADYAEVSFDTAGIYEVSMNASFGLCLENRTKTIVVVEREFNTAIDDTPTLDLSKRITLKTYPNPATNGRFTLEVDMPKPEAISVKIYGVGSNVAIDVKTGEGKAAYEFEYNLSQLPTGLYFILFETASGDQVHKLIIE